MCLSELIHARFYNIHFLFLHRNYWAILIISMHFQIAKEMRIDTSEIHKAEYSHRVFGLCHGSFGKHKSA